MNKTLYYCIHGFEPCNPPAYKAGASREANAVALFAVSVFEKHLPEIHRTTIALGDGKVFFYNTHIF